MKIPLTAKKVSVGVVAALAVLYSCKKDTDNVLSSTDTQNVNSESVSSSATNETADMGNSVMGAVNDTQLNSGSRVAGTIEGITIEPRLKGAIITITRDGSSTPKDPIGVIKIDFGTGQTDAAGVTRKGIIYLAYNGRRWATGSIRKLTFSNYYRNNVRVQGLYTVTNTTDSTAAPFVFHHKLDTGKITFSDGTFDTRIAEFDVAWALNKTTPAQSTISIKNGGLSSNASGVTRKNVAYHMVITKDLVYTYNCLTSGIFIPVGGTKSITVGDGNTALTYTIDYGDGATCDNTVTIGFNGKSKTITVGGDGN